MLHPATQCTLHLPAAIGDYTDFYAGIHHAVNVGRQFRPDQPLLPNYKYVPIGYHGRASSVCPSGTRVRRPVGQRRDSTDAPAPVFGPTRRLDYEVELAIWIAGGNAPGSPIPIEDAFDHVAGFGLLNDWSARDVQAWEYQPLGPFLAKSFATSVSPWVVTPEALAPFRVPQQIRPADDPRPLPYLSSDADQQTGALAITIETLLATPCLQAQGLPAQSVSVTSARHLYWTVAQLIAHHTSNGCNLRPGDLLGSGTISSPTPDGYGSLLENHGRRPKANRARIGRYAHVPRGRGRGDHPRARRTRRLRLHRPRRCPGHRHAVGSIGRRQARPLRVTASVLSQRSDVPVRLPACPPVPRYRV
jgi:fumarylacetoacetase